MPDKAGACMRQRWGRDNMGACAEVQHGRAVDQPHTQGHAGLQCTMDVLGISLKLRGML